MAGSHIGFRPRTPCDPPLLVERATRTSSPSGSGNHRAPCDWERDASPLVLRHHAIIQDFSATDFSPTRSCSFARHAIVMLHRRISICSIK
jgi:hypothetical protein